MATTLNDLRDAIAARAARAGLACEAETLDALEAHARAVLGADPRLHLTTVVDPGEFVERHVGESLEGAARLDPATEGDLLDLGTGNGYPGLAVASVRPRLRAVLAEASIRKAAFMRAVLRAGEFGAAEVFEGQVQRAADVEGIGPFRVLTTRAMGGWPKIVPRMLPALAEDAEILVWAGEDAEAVFGRVVWRKFRLVERHPLPEREHSWIWKLRRA